MGSHRVHLFIFGILAFSSAVNSSLQTQRSIRCHSPLTQCISETRTSYCCHPDESCNSKGHSLSTVCVKHTHPNHYNKDHQERSKPKPKPCSTKAGTTPCKKPDGSYNCCSHDRICIPSGPFKGQCTPNFWLGGPQNCLGSSPSGYVCMMDPSSKSGTCCTSSQACTADGCMDLTFEWPAHCELDGSSACYPDGTATFFEIDGKPGGICCSPYQECAPSGPHKGTCVDRPLSSALVSCKSGLEKCGGKCCGRDISGAPLQCANDKTGVCCGYGQGEVNGKCCPNTQYNERRECCKPGTVAWGETCLDKNGNPIWFSTWPDTENSND